MCGISAAFHYGEKKKDTVNHHIMDVYEEQHHRGKEGFGLICLKNTKEPITIIRATEPIKALVDLYMNATPMAIFHHRSPTETINDLSQTHPIVVESDNLKYNYVVVHNGVIRNAEEMYKKHKEQKFEYTTLYETHYPGRGNLRVDKAVEKFNDSESLAIELAKFLDDKSELIEAQGAAAFVVLQCNKDWTPVALHFGRNNINPLNMYKDESALYLSSEGLGDNLKPNIMYTSKIENPKFELTEKPFKMAEAIISIYQTGPYVRKPYLGTCVEVGCHQERMTGTSQCAEHCDPLLLSSGHKIEEKKSESRKLCKLTGCYKKTKGEKDYCKKHKNTIPPTVATSTSNQTKLGFKTPAEQDALEKEANRLLDLEASKTEMKTEETETAEDENDYTTEDSYCLIDNVIHEYYDMLEADMLPSPEEYGTIIQNLMEQAYAKTEAKIESQHGRPIEYTAQLGEKALEAENYIDMAEAEINDDPREGVPSRGPTLEEAEKIREEIIDKEIEAQQRLNNYF